MNALPARTPHRAPALAAGILLVAAVAFPLPRAAAQDEVRLNGTLRDFRVSHADFQCSPSGGYAHYAGNVATILDADGRPVLAPDGYKVLLDWIDADGRAIPPHLARGGGPGAGSLLANTDVYIRQGEIASFDSTLGPFGGANSGTDAILMTNVTADDAVQVLNNSTVSGRIHVGVGADPDDVIDIDGNCTITEGTDAMTSSFAMPAVDEPTGLGPSIGDLSLGSGPFSGDRHVDTLTLSNNRTVTIQGAVTILCEQDFVMRNRSAIELDPGASLDLYVKGDILLQNNNDLNVNTHDPSRVRFFLIGAGTIDAGNDTTTYAQVVAPDGELYVHNSGEIGGTFVVDRLRVENGAARVYVDTAGATGGGCVAYADVEGRRGVTSTGGIDSAASFAQWFDDELGVNLSGTHQITLRDNGAGVYEYMDDAFYPADGRLFGNDGMGHNYYFTYEVHGEFTADSCAGQFFEFTGGDGAWLFIDDALVLDLGGAGITTSQHLAIDRLDLTDAQTYDFRLLYAQRVAGPAVFRLRTNADLIGVPNVIVSSAHD